MRIWKRGQRNLDDWFLCSELVLAVIITSYQRSSNRWWRHQADGGCRAASREWKLIILAFVMGCIAGSVVHLFRMKVCGAGRMLALGPYLSVGIFIAALWGNVMIDWYLGLFM